MRKYLTAALILSLLCFAGCSASTEVSSKTDVSVESTDSKTPDTSAYEISDEDEALDFIHEIAGYEDSDTGQEYIFDYLDCLEIDGMVFCIYNCSVEDEEGNEELLDTLFVAADKSGLYSGVYDLDKGEASYNDGDNYLDQIEE